MKLNIEKLKEKLNNISDEVYFEVKKLYKEMNDYYINIIWFNNLIFLLFIDGRDLENNIEKLYYKTDSFTTTDVDDMKATLDFISSNEQDIKNAILESIE